MAYPVNEDDSDFCDACGSHDMACTHGGNGVGSLAAEIAALRGENANLRTMLDTNAETMTRSVVEAGKEIAALREMLATADLRIAGYVKSSKHDEETIDKLTAERDELLDGNEGARVYCGQLEDKLAATEAALREAAEWRPMESAPKDGGILAFDPKHGVRPAFYHKEASEWVEDCAEDWGVTLHPILWMPLPPAPGGER